MKYESLLSRTVPALLFTVLLAFSAPGSILAQGPPAPADPPPTPKAIAPIDLTGYWVAVVTEDWRYRMVVADKGDTESVPLNALGKKVAGAWDPAKDAAAGLQCKAFGAGGIMRVPERLHITWENPTTLKVETDAGKQTRIFHFGGKPLANEVPNWQGYSVASWEGLRPGAAIITDKTITDAPDASTDSKAPPKPTAEGYLKVMTTDVRPGYLRSNGVPYSADAVVEEYFDSFKETDGVTWLVVTTIVTDPTYLARPFIVSSQFKKQLDASGWDPTACGSM